MALQKPNEKNYCLKALYLLLEIINIINAWATHMKEYGRYAISILGFNLNEQEN